MLRVGLPSVEDGNPGAARTKCGGKLEGRSHARGVERRRPKHAIRRDPDLGVPAPANASSRAPAQRPPSQALRFVGEEIEALDLERQGYSPQGPLRGGEAEGGLPRPGTRER